MKVKNIAFSGFAAAILAGVGAADAAQQLVTPNYVKAAVNGVEGRVTVLENTVSGMETSKQDVLEAGAGITISDDNVISADMSKATVTVDGQAVSVETALAGKQDALENAAVLESITADNVAAIGTNTTNITNLTTTVGNLADTVADKADASALNDYTKTAELAAVATSGEYSDLLNKPQIPSIEGLATSDELTAGLALKADKSTTYSKTEVDDALALKVNQSVYDVKIQEIDQKLAGAATSGNMESLTNRVTAVEGLVGTDSVADQIAAAVTAQESVDSAQDVKIKALEDAGYQNASQVSTAISGALADYTTTTDMNAALDLKANSADVYTKEQADEAIKAYADANDADTVYDDAEVRGLISTNTTNIATNAGDIADNASAISALQSNTMVAGPATDGLWLAEKKGDTVSWTQVEILEAPESENP